MSFRVTHLISVFIPLVFVASQARADQVVTKTEQVVTKADQVVTKLESTQLVMLKSAKVHEAFSVPHVFHTDAPIAAPKAPPAELVEVAPGIDEDLRKQAVWIPGYWEWDSNSEKFTWTTGIWRFPPPGHRWLSGKWVRHEDGYVRMSGAWLHTKVEKVTYVSAPPAYKGRFLLPASIEKNEFWVPGSWVPATNGKFTWREPFVSRRVEKWEWVPAQYFWGPDGWLFVDGYWDFPVPARGQAFASLRLTNPVYDGEKTRLDAFAPIPSDAIRETSTGEFVYSVESFPEKFKFVATDVKQVDLPATPVVVERVITESPTAVIRGVVRRGDLAPAGIEVQLIGHSAVATTDRQGRFEFTNVPYGVYYLRAVGPVQNHVKRAYGRLTVSEPVVEAEFELR